MAEQETIEQMLTGGHPNSLGRTIEVVDMVLADQSRFADLYNSYQSSDEVVRLRVSNAIKRVYKEQPGWLDDYIDGFINDISQIDQPSTQWTMAQLYAWLEPKMTPSQKAKATEVMKRNISETKDWIVLNATSETLGTWAQDDDELAKWVIPKLQELTKDPHKSVARRAEKLLAKL